MVHIVVFRTDWIRLKRINNAILVLRRNAGAPCVVPHV